MGFKVAPDDWASQSGTSGMRLQREAERSPHRSTKDEDTPRLARNGKEGRRRRKGKNRWKEAKNEAAPTEKEERQERTEERPQDVSSTSNAITSGERMAAKRPRREAAMPTGNELHQGKERG